VLLSDIRKALKISKEDYKIYRAIEMKRCYTENAKPVLELDLQTAHPLRRRLDDTGIVFTLQTAYKRIADIGGFFTMGKTRGTKTNTDPKKGKDASQTKGNLFKTFFGEKSIDFDILIRDLHPMFLTRNDWMSLSEYATSLPSVLAHDKVKICTAFELWIFLRFEFKKKIFLGHDSLIKVVNNNASLRGAFKDTNVIQIYSTLVIYGVKVRTSTSTK
jgi:hypothetical protein